MKEPIIRDVKCRVNGATIQTTRIIQSHDWPSREEWAEEVRTWRRCWGDDDGIRVSSKLSDYMDQPEIDALIANLEVRRSQLGKELRQAKKQRPLAFQQKGETLTQWNLRWIEQLSKEDQEFDVWTWPRREIFQALKLLTDDVIPNRPSEGGSLPELAWLQQRQQSAYDAEVNRIEAEYAQRPIDDEAWAKELARRAEIERIDALPDSEWLVQAH